MTERGFKAGAAIIVSLTPLAALLIGRAAWFAPLMNCLGYEG